MIRSKVNTSRPRMSFREAALFSQARDTIRKHVYQESRYLQTKAKVSWPKGTVNYPFLLSDMMDIGYQYGIHFFILEYESRGSIVHSVYLQNPENQEEFTRISSDGRNSLELDTKTQALDVIICICLHNQLWVGNHYNIQEVTTFTSADKITQLPDVSESKFTFISILPSTCLIDSFIRRCQATKMHRKNENLDISVNGL